MPGERGRECVICDAASLLPAAIPRRPCAHVAMISLAVSESDVEPRDWSRNAWPPRVSPQTAGAARQSIRDQ
jgi:hypothetical protein